MIKKNFKYLTWFLIIILSIGCITSCINLVYHLSKDFTYTRSTSMNGVIINIETTDNNYIIELELSDGNIITQEISIDSVSRIPILGDRVPTRCIDRYEFNNRTYENKLIDSTYAISLI